MAGTEVLMMEKFLLTQCLWPANIHILLVVLDTLQSFLLNPYRLNFWLCGLVSLPLHRDSGLDGNLGEYSIMTGMKGETCLSCLTIPSHANAFYDAFCLTSHHTTLADYSESECHIFHPFCAAGNCVPRIIQKSLIYYHHHHQQQQHP